MLLAKDLRFFEQLVNNINNRLADLKNTIIEKEITENENSNKIADIVKKILNFNKKQKVKGLKILAPKQILQRLPIALAQVTAGNASEILLNEICQIIYSLYQEKEVTKKE